MQLPARDLLSRSVRVSSDARLTQPWLPQQPSRWHGRGLLEETHLAQEVAPPGSDNPLLTSTCLRRKSFLPSRCAHPTALSRPSLALACALPRQFFLTAAAARIGRAENSTHRGLLITLPAPHWEARCSPACPVKGGNPLRGLRCQSGCLASTRVLDTPRINVGKLSQQIGRLPIMLSLHAEPSRTQ